MLPCAALWATRRVFGGKSSNPERRYRRAALRTGAIVKNMRKNKIVWLYVQVFLCMAAIIGIAFISHWLHS